MRPSLLLFALSAGSLALAPAATVAAQEASTPQPVLDFGDDSGEWALDGQCDDIRYTGDGMAGIELTDSIGKDASDCSAALKAGTVTEDPMHLPPANDAAIKFGDDASEFAQDGECDDIRFAGSTSTATIFIAEDIGHDASDCRSAFEAGMVKWQGSTATPERGMSTDEILERLNEEAPLV